MQRNLKYFLVFGIIFVLIGCFLIAMYFFDMSRGVDDGIFEIIIAAIFAALGIVLVAVWLKRRFTYDGVIVKNIRRYLNLKPSPIRNFSAELAQIEKNFSADMTPQRNEFKVPRYNGSEKMADFFTLDHGKIYYGCVVQANELLFNVFRGMEMALPAVIVYSDDEYFSQNPSELIKVADYLYSHKDVNFLRDEYTVFSNLELHPEVVEERKVYATCVMICRRHLPMGCLTGAILTVIADPENSTSTFVIDVKYWTENFVANYLENFRRCFGREDKFDEFFD